jgi:DNA-binding Lrp family transcriptional regulator
MHRIDDLDKLILEQLLLDGRKSLVDIAKDCGVSSITIGKHFDKLKKEGIITGSTLQINYRHLGLNTVFTLNFRIRPDQSDEICQKIRRMKNLYILFQFQKFASAVFTLNNQEEMNSTKEELKKIRVISDLKTYLWLDIRNQRENLDVLYENARKSQNVTNLNSKEKINETKKVDELDIKLIDILSINSRMSFRDVSKQVDAAIDTISRRYERLRRNGTIRAIIQINPQKLGYQAGWVVGITFANEVSFKGAFEEYAKFKNCVFIIQTSGETDLILIFLIKNLEEFLEIQDKLMKISSIQILDSNITRLGNVYPYRREFISTI